MLPFTRFSLDNSRLVLLLLLLVLLAGPISFLSHPSREDPKITIRTALVTATYPGMAPERVENLITRKIEEKIREIPEIEHIRSTSRNGTATIKADIYERYFDTDRIWQQLRNKMQDVKPDLPEGTNGPLINDDYGNVAMATVALTGEGFSLAEMREQARFLRDRLYAVSGVRKIELFGIEEERIYIEIDNTRLAQLGLSPTTIINTLQKQNIILPGGKIEAGPISYVIEPTGNFESPEDIASVTLEIPNSRGQVAYLRDIAAIKRAYIDPPKAPAFFNNKPAIVLGVSMVDQFDADKFGKDLSAKITALEHALPIGYKLSFITFQPKDIANAIDGVMSNLYQTIVIVLVVVMLFLGWRTGLIVGFMVPMTMLASILVMRFVGIELERMSLATLIISLGLLVDNGIVIAEEISRRIAQGENRRTAIIATGQALALPLLSSSLTTVFAFMPLMLADSTAGEYTRSISLVIAITLLGSWLLAMTITPLLCYWFIKQSKPVDEAAVYNSRFYQTYHGFLSRILQFRTGFLIAIIGLMAVAVWAFQFVPKIFFPASERTQFQIIVDHPVGGNAKATINTVDRLSSWLIDNKKNPEIVNTVAYVASGGPRFYLSLNPVDPDPHRAFVLVNVAKPEDVATTIRKVEIHALNSFPEARIQVKPLSLGPGEVGLVEYRISGGDSDRLKALAESLKTAMRRTPNAINIKDDWENRWVKVIVAVDQARARRVGVTSEDVARTLNAILSGNAITSYREGDTTIPVVVRAKQAQRTNLDRLRTLAIPTANGGSVPLLQIADFKGAPEFSLIQRRDLSRSITVSGKNTELTAAEFDAILKPAIATLKLPPGYEIEVGGELEGSSKAQGSLFANMPLAFALITLVLVGQFASYRRAVIILLVIPLSIIGVSFGLLIAPGSNFGFMAILGLLSLAGIIINNAIVLIDRIELERQNGMLVNEAILTASVKRLRPILMTTATTVLGLSPIILSKDVLFYDMAVVISGGLTIGTIFTLGVVPVLYSTFVKDSKTVDTNIAASHSVTS